MDDDQDDQCPQGGVGASPLHIAQSPDKPVDGSEVCTILSSFTIVIIINNTSTIVIIIVTVIIIVINFIVIIIIINITMTRYVPSSEVAPTWKTQVSQ